MAPGSWAMIEKKTCSSSNPALRPQIGHQWTFGSTVPESDARRGSARRNRPLALIVHINQAITSQQHPSLQRSHMRSHGVTSTHIISARGANLLQHIFHSVTVGIRPIEWDSWDRGVPPPSQNNNNNSEHRPPISWTVTSPRTTVCAPRASHRPAGRSNSARSRTARELVHALEFLVARRAAAVTARSARLRCSPWASRTTSRRRTRWWHGCEFCGGIFNRVVSYRVVSDTCACVRLRWCAFLL
jgi:hypothetical protein